MPTSSSGSVSSTAIRLTEPLDTLEFADGRRLAVRDAGGHLTAVPEVRGADGRWRRARPGDGAAVGLVDALARGSADRGAFTIRSWSTRKALGERAVGVDQTNESVIVGDTAVVKWATHLQDGPHPAPRRLGVLRAAGFTGMPTPWGMVTWRTVDGTETLVAYVDDYLSGAVDGWTWAVDLITGAAHDGNTGALTAAVSEVGIVVAELHAALSVTATAATGADAARWRDDALRTLERVCAIADCPSAAYARAHRSDIAGVLDRLGSMAGTAIIDGHGDLHVGQILRSRGRFVVTDFDGNPVLPASQRVLPIPAALDVAGMTQSLVHAGIVAGKHGAVAPADRADAEVTARTAFLAAYALRLTALGHPDLYDPSPLRAFRLQQVLREMIYAADHLPRWMYVPDAALPALLDDGATP